MMHTVPLPGCELYRTASEFGDFDNDWRQLCGWKVAFLPHGLSHETLVYYANTAVKRFYFRPRIVWNYLQRIRSLRHATVYASALMAFLAYVSKKKRCSAGIASVAKPLEVGTASRDRLLTSSGGRDAKAAGGLSGHLADWILGHAPARKTGGATGSRRGKAAQGLPHSSLDTRMIRRRCRSPV